MGLVSGEGTLRRRDKAGCFAQPLPPPTAPALTATALSHFQSPVTQTGPLLHALFQREGASGQSRGEVGLIEP